MKFIMIIYEIYAEKKGFLAIDNFDRKKNNIASQNLIIQNV